MSGLQNLPPDVQRIIADLRRKVYDLERRLLPNAGPGDLWVVDGYDSVSLRRSPASVGISAGSVGIAAEADAPSDATVYVQAQGNIYMQPGPRATLMLARVGFNFYSQYPDAGPDLHAAIDLTAYGVLLTVPVYDGNTPAALIGYLPVFKPPVGC